MYHVPTGCLIGILRPSFYIFLPLFIIAPTERTVPIIAITLGSPPRRGAMVGLQPFLWLLLTWMIFPALALAAESSDGIKKLRPWSPEPIQGAASATKTATCGEEPTWSCSIARCEGWDRATPNLVAVL